MRVVGFSFHAHQGLEQVAVADSEGQVVEVRSGSAGKATGRLQFVQTSLAEPEILQSDRQLKRLEERQQLSSRLACELITAQAFLQTKLHKDSEAHLFAVEHAMTGHQLGETVMDSVGSNRAALGST